MAKPIEERFIYKEKYCPKCCRLFKTNKAGILPIHISMGHHICKGSEKSGVNENPIGHVTPFSNTPDE